MSYVGVPPKNIIVQDQVIDDSSIDVVKINISGVPNGNQFLRDDSVWVELPTIVNSVAKAFFFS